MKLLVQIPCYNEEKTLPLVVRSIPRHIDGIDQIEVLVIDDGSKDKTAEVAQKLGVDHILRHPSNKGLAVTFADGLTECLRLGADIIVNTDADNQYPQADISKLVQPIIRQEADIVIGDRQTSRISHFSRTKKIFQSLGSAAVRFFSKTQVPDAVSGFRAYSRDAALEFNIVTGFSYVIETIIQAHHKKLRIRSIPVNTNPPTRKSRLFTNTFSHIEQSTAAILRVYTMYQPLKIFMALGVVICFFGLIPALRFVIYSFKGEGAGHIQSLIFAAILIMVGFNIIMTGLVADLIAINRKLLESTLYKLKNLEINEFIKTS